jgi:hypothetical protein
MPTGDEYVNLVLKRFLSQIRMDTNFLTYLKTLAQDVHARIFPESGVFTYPVDITYGSGVFSLSVTPAGDISGADSLGHTVILATARQSNIPFEDDGTNTYWIAMKHIEIPSGIYDNPRTGLPEYDKTIEEVGEVDNPDVGTVIDDGDATITMDVNSIFESGVDHSGRVVRVWLENPMSSDEAVAFEDCTVTYASSDNTIATTGDLGQTVISTVHTDYKVACLGVTVRESATNPFASSPEYILIGSIDSSQTAPAGTTDDTLQIDLSGGGGHSIQNAYNGAGGDGDGRDATIDYEAIQLLQTSTGPQLKDIYDAVLRVRKDGDTSVIALPEWIYEGGIDSVHRLFCNYSFLHRASIADGGDQSGAALLNPEETVDLIVSTANVDFTRVGVDLTLATAEGKIQELGAYAGPPDLCEIRESAEGQDGVYMIDSVTDADTLVLKYIDGTSPSWTAETGVKARLFRSLLHVGAGGEIVIKAIDDFAADHGVTSALIGTLRVVLPDDTPYNKNTGLAVYNYSNTASIKITAGQILASDLSAYAFGSAETFYLHMDGSEGLSESDGTGAPSWIPQHLDAGTTIGNSIQSLATGYYVSFPLRIPSQADVTQIDILLDDNATAITVIEVVRMDHDYATPGLGDIDQFDTASASSGGGTLEKATIGPSSPMPMGIVPQTYSYAIRLKSTAVGQAVYSVLVTYTTEILQPT